MEIELRDLRYFLAVAQQESITKAAEYLFIAQPSLSRRMQKLESELNRLLFVRGSRKVTLTQAGELLKKRAEEMLQLYEKTQAELLADGESLSGDVYIGGGESCGVRIVARAAKQIQSKHPEVKFHFFSGDTHDVKDKLDKGLIDFGVFRGAIRLNRIRLYPSARGGHVGRANAQKLDSCPKGKRHGKRPERTAPDLFAAQHSAEGS